MRNRQIFHMPHDEKVVIKYGLVDTGELLLSCQQCDLPHYVEQQAFRGSLLHTSRTTRILNSSDF
jgi:hypothetical protein